MYRTSAGLCLFLLVVFCLSASVLCAPILVDWGHDWGGGWYRHPPEKDNNSAWRPLAEVDLNENGTTKDDRTGGWAYSLTETLSPYNLVYDYTYPSAKFYGAAIVQVTDIPEKEGGGYENVQAPSEGHINQNHELRDDWNLMTFPARKIFIRKKEITDEPNQTKHHHRHTGLPSRYSGCSGPATCTGTLRNQFRAAQGLEPRTASHQCHEAGPPLDQSGAGTVGHQTAAGTR